MCVIYNTFEIFEHYFKDNSCGAAINNKTSSTYASDISPLCCHNSFELHILEISRCARFNCLMFPYVIRWSVPFSIDLEAYESFVVGKQMISITNKRCAFKQRFSLCSEVNASPFISNSWFVILMTNYFILCLACVCYSYVVKF